jgi:hypothetical protein
MARETRQLRAMRPAPVRGVGEMSDQEADLLGAPRTPEEFEDRAQVADVRAAWLAALIRRNGRRTAVTVVDSRAPPLCADCVSLDR